MTTALYRRYRPETFQDVIGQEHVTEPLMTALRKNRVNHAYLFSGPRGCGKTTSARILARCLNCVEGPTATPCGHCDSCRDLARDGAGSLDVIEMDAASHGGVDHARDLRERATFAPVRDRYKIFIIDEAHMVTREGFNALLKIVEEPPEHVKFIFATTEPSKVLTTIRSRTHHYPFRLVPPEPLMHYLERLCDQEGVSTEPGVLSLVVRAGGGSVRDSLSVLDQLMAGSDDGGITYDLSVALLGYTHAALLDDVVDAFAAGDAATVFAAVDRVIQTGQDPRRFVEDLLERFRDLVVVNAVPDSAANILHGMPTDQINRLRNQAAQLGAAELSRAADITNTALNEMTGATSPQLHLELLCARILLPSADDTSRGVTARVDRLERRLSIPRGAGIRPSSSETPQSSVDDAAPALPPSSPLRAPAPAHAEPVQDRPVERIAEPTDPQDGTEEPEGTDHPAASAPVPHAGTLADHGRPPADGRTGPGEPAAAHGHGTPHRTGDEFSFGERTATREEPREEREHPVGPEPRDAQRQEQETAPVGATTPDGETEDRQATSEAGGEPSHSGDIELLRSSWTEIVAALAEIRRVAWTVIMRGTPVAFDGQTLRIAFEAEGDLLNFPRFENDVRAAIQQVLGIGCRVEAVHPGDVQGRSSGGQDSSGPRSGADQGNPRRPPSHEGGGNGWAQTVPPRGDLGHSSPPREPGRSGMSPGAGPTRSSDPGEGSRAPRPGAPEDERPEYFREPEGFGANRRRPSGSQARRSEQQQRETAAASRGGQGNDRRGAPEPTPGPDEPVTSWSVVKIPQGAPETPDDAPGAGSEIQPSDDGQHPRPREVQDARPSVTGAEKSAAPVRQDHGHVARRSDREGDNGQEQTVLAAGGGRSPDSPAAQGRSSESRSEYWAPPEPPPPPEDEPPADLYETSGSRPGFSGAGQPAPSGQANASYAGTATASPTAQPPAQASAQPGGQATAQRSRPSWRERHAAELAAAQRQQSGDPQAQTAPAVDEDFVPSADDESIEDSALHGRAAIERLLGGILIDERPHNPEQ